MKSKKKLIIIAGGIVGVNSHISLCRPLHECYLESVMSCHMVLIKRMISLIFVSLLFAFSLTAKPLIVGLKESPPQIIKGTGGTPTGPTVEKLRMVFDKADLEVEIKIYPVKQLKKYMRSGKIDMGMSLEAGKLPFFARFKYQLVKILLPSGSQCCIPSQGCRQHRLRILKEKHSFS